jgi:hypothetical protein
MPPVITSLPPYPTAENVLQLVRTLVLDAGISIAGNLLGDNSPGVVIASISESGGTVTVTTQQAHGLNVGNLVMVSNVVPAGYNGQFAVVSVPALNQFTYLNPAVGLATGAGGSVSISPSQAFILLNSAYQYVQDKIANLGFETPIGTRRSSRSPRATHTKTCARASAASPTATPTPAGKTSTTISDS